MSNTIGEKVRLTIFGESHGPYVGAVLDGLEPGVPVDEDFLNECLAKRRPNAVTDTAREEKDKYQIISGVFNGYTTGAPICILIPNENVKSGDYNPDVPRPSHADYVTSVDAKGFNDYRGGGHTSGRVTAPIVALGSIAIKRLESKGIKLGTHILRCGHVVDSEFHQIEKEFDLISMKKIPVIDNTIEEEMEKVIVTAKEKKDSIGGILQTAIIGLPLGVGDPWFESLEGVIANAMFSIGGIKGIEFGAGFHFADGLGSSLNDELAYENGRVVTISNNNGGINGGLSNGMPVIFNLAVKPTPSIAQPQRSINLRTGENVIIEIKGRHDPAIIRRIVPVVNALLAVVLLDEIVKKFGEDYFK